MITYRLNVYDVSGDNAYTIVTFYKSEALKFLKQYDHKGSTIDLVITDSDKQLELYEQQEVYEALNNGNTDS